MNLCNYWLLVGAIGCWIGGTSSANDTSAETKKGIEEIRNVLDSILPPDALARKNGTQLNAHSNTTTQRTTTTVDYDAHSAHLFCEPEEFLHDLVVAEDEQLEMFNMWQRAQVGQRMGLQTVCLLPNGLPLTRLCRYNDESQRAEWEDISQWPRKSCIKPSRSCQLSTKLNNLHGDIVRGQRRLNDSRARINVTTQLYGLLSEPKYRVLPADVHLTTQILHELTAQALDTDLTSDMVSICNTLMAADTNVLRLSADLNATNSLLDTFESYLDAVAAAQVPSSRCGLSLLALRTARPGASATAIASQLTNNSRIHNAVQIVDLMSIGVRVQLSANVSVFYVNPKCTNITGIAIFALSTQHGSSTATHRTLMQATLPGFSYRFVYMHESAQDVMQEADLEVAAFLPTELWHYVAGQMAGKTPVLVLKVYAHDALFVEPSPVRKRKPFSWILSISIPGFTEKFPQNLPFMLRNHHVNLTMSTINSGCGYWNYSTWVTTDVTTDITGVSVLRVPVIQCGTPHLTQFSFLLGGSYKQYDPSGDVLVTPVHERVLDVISLVGCSLSLLGLLGIWLTAAVLRSWRALASTKLLLHLCLALTLQMFLFVFVNTDDLTEHLIEYRHYNDCIAIGALMQYTILVLFCWMLIVALLQFQRYVTVIGIERPRRYILKAALVAWGVPLLPTLLVVLIAPESYIPSEYELQQEIGICYPSGSALTFGIVMPVAFIVCANLCIFVYIFYSISRSLGHAINRTERLMIAKQIRLSVLLFFLLGLSWIFGILAYMHAGLVFSYLFCLTATMQGLVLFVYFVLLDEAVRKAWLKLLRPRHMLKLRKRNTELQSMNTTSTNVPDITPTN